VRVEILSSTPPTPLEGSGTFVALDGLARGLRALGHEVRFRPLRRRTGFHTLDRWLYNAHVAATPPDADLVVGVDLDGFRWARRRPRPPYVVALKGIIADELRNERGWVRVLLGLQARWERRNARLADRVVVPSLYSAGIAREVYALAAGVLAVVPEPVDLAGWRQAFAAVTRRSPGQPTVLSVARMYPRKRLEDLVTAGVTLRARIPAVRIRIVGDGPEAGRLRQLVGRLGLQDTVAFLGAVSRRELAVEYVSADCFCLPTVQEGFGLVFAEAMAAGLAVVGCRAAAVPEVVADGETGLLVTPRRPEELAVAMAWMLENEDARTALGGAGRRRVEAFDPVRVARQFLATVTA
jgi:glycosyltransferase involved in cell wall biosynthesis